MSVVLFGYHNMGCIALKVLRELNVSVPAVFTHRDDPDENRWFDSLGELAGEMDIPVYFPEDVNTGGWVRLMKDLSPESPWLSASRLQGAVSRQLAACSW